MSFYQNSSCCFVTFLSIGSCPSNSAKYEFICGLRLISNQKVVGYSLYICATIEPVGWSYQVIHYCSFQVYLGMVEDYFSPLVAGIAPCIKMKFLAHSPSYFLRHSISLNVVFSNWLDCLVVRYGDLSEFTSALWFVDGYLLFVHRNPRYLFLFSFSPPLF